MCNSTVAGTDFKNTAFAAVFGSVMTLGLPFNVVSLWILIRRHSLRSPSAVLMVNLALSDLLLVISLPTRVYFYATGTWPLTQLACLSATMLYRNNIRSSSIFITFISVDRLLAVVYPLRSRHLRTASNAWKAAALVWLFVVAVNIPESVEFSNRQKDCCKYSCFEYQNCTNPDKPVLKYFQPVLVLTMLVVNVFCTALVSLTLRGHLRNSAGVNNKVNVMLIFVMNLMMFTIFFLPVSLSLFFRTKPSVIKILVCLASINCCVDPLLYYFSFDGFWKKKEDVSSSLGRE